MIQTDVHVFGMMWMTMSYSAQRLRYEHGDVDIVVTALIMMLTRAYEDVH